MTRELSSLQNWVYAKRLTINYDPEKSLFSCLCPQSKQMSEASTRLMGYKFIKNIVTHQNKIPYMTRTYQTAKQKCW